MALFTKAGPLITIPLLFMKNVIFKILPLLFALAVTTLIVSHRRAETHVLPFRDTSLPLNGRISDLIGRLTLEEKIMQLNYESPAVPRLGIPAYNWWNEALHGVARAGKATVFPQALGLASTWDEDLVHQVAEATATEARAKYNYFSQNNVHKIYTGLTFFSPNINIFRDPRWGRGHETYGEDPHLTSRLGVSFIKGLQGNDPSLLKVSATAKHFAVHSGPEYKRHTFNAKPTPQDLWETYLPAFEAAIKEGKVESIMCAYNRFEDAPCCGSDPLLKNILREQWDFEGFVVSDCWAVVDFYKYHQVVPTPEEAAAMALKSGTDLNCGDTFEALPGAVAQGLISEDDIDKALHRLFKTRFRLGMFDDSFGEMEMKYVACDGHQKLALEASRKSLVLLKNDKNTLPLSKSISSLAVIGPNADHEESLLGNYHGTPSRLVTPLKALQEKYGEEILINYARGCDIVEGLPQLEVIPAQYLVSKESKPGLCGKYFNNMFFEGEEVIHRVDPGIDFTWYSESPANGKVADSLSIRWEGWIEAPKSGRYQLGFRGASGVSFYFEDSLRFTFDSFGKPKTATFDQYLHAGQKYPVKIDFYSYGADPQAHLLWAYQEDDLLPQALEAAKNSDAIVFFMGLSPRVEGEEMEVELEGFSGGDRTKLALPEVQTRLMKEVAKLGKPMTLVMVGGGAMAFPWENENMDAIIYACYPGERGGEAIADLIFGEFSPTGRLPVTFYRSVDQLPGFEDYGMEGRTYRFFGDEPLYPFGHGLSYTSFEYSQLQVASTIDKKKPLELKVNVTNKGRMAGEEVVQVYFSQRGLPYRTPIRSLVDFQKVLLEPGATKQVSFTLEPDQLSTIDEMGKKSQQPGEITLSIGGKQPGFKGLKDAMTTGVITQKVMIQ